MTYTHANPFIYTKIKAKYLQFHNISGELEKTLLVMDSEIIMSIK